MIVEQIDAFKTWLTAVLKPMCDADPEALAKYVLALVKKDKSDEELRKSMVGQLDVFLEAETETFVDLVFQTLSTKEYLNTPVIPNTNPPNPNPGKLKEVKESKIIIEPSELPNLNDVVNGTSKKDVDAQVKRDKENRKNSDAEKDDKPPERPIRRRSPPRPRSLSRIRSRSRSWDRIKRSRSREKSRDRLDREQHRIDREKRERPRAWRNKSPPRRYRRASRTPSPIRARSRSRSPRHSHRSRYRARNTTSRSRSRSLDKRDRRDSGKDKDKDASRPASPFQDANNADAESRLPNSGAQNITQGGNKKRCRDYDEKGYCMSGEMCPFDHGVDPVVVEDSALSTVLAYNPNSNRTGGPPVMLPTPVLTAPGAHAMLGQRLPLQPDNPYNPQAPHIWREARFRGPRPMGMVRPPLGVFPPQPNMNRELIAVPVMDNKQSDGYSAPFGHPNTFINNLDHDNNIYKKKQFDFNRLGPRSKNPQNCSLELKKVPQGMNSITHLNNHFSKFGKIVNIQVQYEGDPEAAIITFSSHAEANAAYRSTEAVLNNRFIKVFWHNQSNMDGKQENVPPPPRSIKDRLGTQTLVAPNVNKVLNLVQPKADNVPPGTEDEPTTEKEDFKSSEEGQATKDDTKAPVGDIIKRNPDMLSVHSKVNKNPDVRRKQVMQIQSDLRKKKQELLDKQLSQQKILIEKMEKMPPGPARDKIKDTIKKTHDAIAAITKDLEAAALAAKSAPPAKKTKEEVQREILDTELDLMAKQQEGVDTTELAKRLAELRAKVATAASLRGGLVRGRGALARRYNPVVMGRHLLTKNNLKMKAMKTVNKVSVPNATALSNSVTTSTVATSFLKHTVDHRPTRLLVSGYETDEQDSVLTHFMKYGEVIDYEVDTSLPSITLNYKTRKEAEQAMLKGKHFQDRTLSITWSSKQLSRQRSSGSTTRTVLMSETDEEQLIDQSLLEGDDELGPELSEEVLLQDDEEEEEEDRSWRR